MNFLFTNAFCFTSGLPKCSNMSSECKYVNYRSYSDMDKNNTNKIVDGLICENKFDGPLLNSINKTRDSCKRMQESILIFAIKQSARWQIVNCSFRVFKLGEIFKDQRDAISLMFLYAKGFDIDSRINVNFFNTLTFYSEFNLYRQNRLVRGCNDFSRSQPPGFIFYQTLETQLLYLRIIRPKSSHPICSDFFNGSFLEYFTLTYVAESFFTSNTLSFEDPLVKSPNNGLNKQQRLNCRIGGFIIDDSYGLKIDSKLINSKIFANTPSFIF